MIIAPVHDTVFNFDSTGKVCMVCERNRGLHPNKFIKTPIFSYHCTYFNKNGGRLVIKLDGEADTTSIFALLKASVSQFSGNTNVMTVSVKDKNMLDHKYLVDKDFKQLTFKSYSDVRFSEEPSFLIASKKNEGSVMVEGFLNLKEEEILPFRYSHIKLNTTDSLVIGCTAGLGLNSEDDIYDYTGKKISSYHRHIELATKKFVVHKIFSPKEYLVILNLATGEEKQEIAEEAHYYTSEEVLLMNEGHWFTYNILTYKKKSYDYKHKK